MPRASKDKEAHALVNFMLKERKDPKGGQLIYPTGYTNNHEVYVEWVRDWETRYGGMSQEELCIPPSEPAKVIGSQPFPPRGTKAERFYEFLTTRYDNSGGLWGIVSMELQVPVRGGDDFGWAREDVGAVITGKAWTNGDMTAMINKARNGQECPK
jgi:hypothetical protein